MKDIETKAVEILDNLEKLATQYAPDVMNLAVETVRVNGMSTIFEGFFWLLSFIVCFLLWKKFFPYISEKFDDIFGVFVGTIVAGIYTGISFIGVITCLFDFWAWVSIFNPELALAKQVLGL